VLLDRVSTIYCRIFISLLPQNWATKEIMLQVGIPYTWWTPRKKIPAYYAPASRYKLQTVGPSDQVVYF